ncbi:MAG: hypothetical protein LPK45_08600 [Bacteroidota bacterium]|nr:hypothetical protein [Bacteroidota bacterium]MDX5431135.1 hypothetical protein [Bacteroidota bacterium]MDX5469882.1 hypothetical protein [Bacteroidota bacterium]
MSPTLTLGTTYTDGSTEFTSPDNKTGKNTLYPLYSVLDGYPNPNLKPIQNLARKFTWGILTETYLNENYSFNLGFEVGARGYKLHSERSVSSLISWRNLSVPIYFSRYKWLGSFWTLKFNYGGHLNYAWSLPQSNKIARIEKSPELYPTLGGGIEMAYMGKEGKLSFEMAYYHGWRNIIDHVYIGVDNQYGERITATGSHLRLSLKYNMKKFTREKRERKATPPVSVMAEEYKEPYMERIRKKPETLEVKHQHIEFCFLDDQTVDGDSIQISWNDTLVNVVIGLDKSPLCLPMDLKSGKNTLIVHAMNEGRIRPNTYEIRVKDGDELKTIRMKSDLESSAVLEVWWKP